MIFVLALALTAFAFAACSSEAPATNVGGYVTPYPAPDFTLTALNGGSLSLSTMRGRWVILNFWATWCVPCGTEMPALQTIADERSGQVALFGINMRESDDDMRTYMTRHHLSFPILTNPDDNVLNNYNLQVGVPQTLIISPEGQIVYHVYGAIDLDQFRNPRSISFRSNLI